MARDSKLRDFSGLKVKGARVIPWVDHSWGVAVEYEGGKHQAYAVGSREDAEREADRRRAE